MYHAEEHKTNVDTKMLPNPSYEPRPLKGYELNLVYHMYACMEYTSAKFLSCLFIVALFRVWEYVGITQKQSTVEPV